MSSESGNNGEANGGAEQNIGFSVEHMDRSADPMTNFFIYAAGNWIKTHPVPSHKATWGGFEQLREKNTHDLRAILEECASGSSQGSDGIRKRLGEFYRSSMNTEKLESLGFSPVSGEMAELDAVKGVDSFAEVVSKLHSGGVFAFFRMFSRADRKNSSVYAMYLFQGGLSLPNRDYYTSDTFAELRQQYLKHMEKMFSLFGESAENAGAHAQAVLKVEMKLAGASRRQAELRDAEKNYNRVQVSDLNSKFPGLRLADYLKNLGVPAVEYVVVGQPEFFEALSSLISELKVEEFRAYLRWMALNSAAPFLFPKVEDEHFDMFSRKLRGQQEPEPRWMRSVHVIDQLMGEALGELYVRDHFGQASRERMAVLIDEVRAVFRDRITRLPWMTEETKEHALAKFARFRPKIGHPEKFRDYSSVEIREDDYYGNVSRCAAFEIGRQINRIGSKVDRDEWMMSPPTVNAYFSPPDNEIVFPAGILQPPFFDVNADDAVNYGAIGAVICHEMTHGYDDQGRRYDEEGNLRDWWKPEDGENFTERADRVVDLYSSLEPLPGLHVDGRLTLGENIADFGGVTIAYEALQRHLEKHPELRRKVDGLTPEQRFFISWAQLWRENIQEPEIRRRVSLDPHSPNKFRGCIPIYNHPEFEKVFSSFGKAQNAVTERGKIDIW